MPEKPLPELTPEMMLSYGGLRELEGAQQTQRVYRPSGPAQAVDADWAEFGNAMPPPVDDNEITFDQGDDIEFDSVPERHYGTGRAVGDRFSVLRPPQHEPFRPTIEPGPQGGPMREVGRVGRFAILAEQGRPEPSIDYVAEARARLEDRVLASPRQQPVRSFAEERRLTAATLNARQSAKQQAERAAIHDQLPTCYDRLMGEDPFDDDLE